MIRLVDKPKILVVNDDANSLFALTNLLEQWAARKRCAKCSCTTSP
jgi:hypothetical protein